VASTAIKIDTIQVMPEGGVSVSVAVTELIYQSVIELGIWDTRPPLRGGKPDGYNGFLDPCQAVELAHALIDSAMRVYRAQGRSMSGSASEIFQAAAQSLPDCPNEDCGCRRLGEPVRESGSAWADGCRALPFEELRDDVHQVAANLPRLLGESDRGDLMSRLVIEMLIDALDVYLDRLPAARLGRLLNRVEEEA